jgi:hypothetical protein
MFQDLDATLKALLADPAAPAGLRAADVSFQTPDKDFQPAQATLNLFLYEVKENRVLRDAAPVITKVDDTYVSRPSPIRMDCTYLGTTWSAKTAGLKAEEEHRLLGLALMWFNRFPEIGAGYFQGGLLNPPQPHPLPTALAQTGEDQSMGQFWTALGISPRPAFTLTVTIAMPSADDTVQDPIVAGIELQDKLLETDS